MASTPNGERLNLPGWVPALFAALAFAVCVFYTYVLLALVPAPGFNAIDADWQVVSVDPSVAGRNLILPDDLILQIGNLTQQQYFDDRVSVPFGGFHPGDRVPVTLVRKGQTLVVQWVMPPVSQAELVSRLTISVPAFLFLIVGLIIQLLLRPRNLPWMLLLSFCYLTAVWLSLGVVSTTQILRSSLFLHAVTWLLSAAILDLHLTFPRSVSQRRSRELRPALYALAGLAAALELFALPARALYELALLVVLLVSLGLLIYHIRRGSAG